MITVEEIAAIYKDRLEERGPLLQKMREIRQLSNGDIIVPLSELDRSQKSSIANLLNQGLDQMSMRVASTMPVPYFPMWFYDDEEKDKAALNHLIHCMKVVSDYYSNFDKPKFFDYSSATR